MESIGLCKYKDIFGRPNEGGHSYRIFNIAIMDVVFTIIGAIIFSWLFNIAMWKSIVGLFLLGIFFHRLFCVRTTIDKVLFP
jgi:hypothetical protein